MYQLLHIPSGSYMYNGFGVPVTYEKLEWAEEDLNSLVIAHKRPWNKYNKQVGWPVYREEFEIIEVPDV
jgi:hypothetical protein